MFSVARFLCLLVLVLNVVSCSSSGSTPPDNSVPTGNTRTITLALIGTGGGTVTSNPAGLQCNTTVQTCVGQFPVGTAIVLTATANASHSFQEWITPNCPGTGTCAFTLNDHMIVSAVFNGPTAAPTVSISKQGLGSGTITSSVGGINCGPTCTSTALASGTSITLTAVPDGTSSFTGWAGTGCSGTTPCTFTVTANTVITGSFSPIVATPTLTVSIAGVGTGTVTSMPAGISCPATCAQSFSNNTAITLTATPTAGSTFTGWSGACSGTGACIIALTANTPVTATFTMPTLTLQVLGAGSVSSNPSGVSCPGTCVVPFPAGTSITLTATPAGIPFSGWTGGACTGTGTCVVVLNSDTPITATFGAVSGAPDYKFLYQQEFGTPVTISPLIAVDPANPSSPITVHPNVHFAASTFDGTWSAPSFTGIRASHTVYVAEDKLWKVSNAKSAGVPGTLSNPGVQISSENALSTGLCDLDTIAMNPASQTLLVYQTPGPDGDCTTTTDNVLKRTTLNATTGTAPATIGSGYRLVFNGSLYDLSTGSVPTLLLINPDTNVLAAYTVATNTVTPMPTPLTSGFLTLISQPTTNRAFLVSNNALYVYDDGTKSVTTLLTAAAGSNLLWGNVRTTDDTYLYTADWNGTIYRTPLTATASNQVQTVATLGTSIGQIALTDNRIVYMTFNIGTNARGLSSIPKTGGGVTPILASSPDQFASVNDVINGQVYYAYNALGSPFTAAVASETGTPVATYPNSSWAGGILSTTYSPANTLVQDTVLSLLYTDGPTGPMNGTIKSIAPATPAVAQPLGTVPGTAVIQSIPFFFYSLNPAFIGAAISNTNSLPFFLDSQSATLSVVPLSPGPWHPVF
jgi:hypothetical protein